MDFRNIQALANDSVLTAFKEAAAFTYEQPGQDAIEVEGVLSQQSEVIETGGMAQVIASENPMITILESDLGFTPKRGDRLSLSDQSYIVSEFHPDGYGGFKIMLRLA
jgi:hypothetical protein